MSGQKGEYIGRNLMSGERLVCVARVHLMPIVVPAAFAYIRLLGDRQAVDALTPTLDHIVIDRGAEVETDARAIQVLRQRVPVVAFVNNHYAGYAPETARQLAALTGQAASA
jgi:uncharacterized protein YecE (DUF72 family)